MLCSLAELAQYRTEQPLNIESKHWAYLPSLAVIAADLHTAERKCPFPLLANCFLNNGLKQLKDYEVFKRSDDFRVRLHPPDPAVCSYFNFNMFSLKKKKKKLTRQIRFQCFSRGHLISQFPSQTYAIYSHTNRESL